MKKNPAARYVITTLLGLTITVALLLGRGGLNAPDQQQFFQALSDAFFVPGIVLTGMGLLVFVADEGLFDMINYGVMKVIRLIQSEKKQAAAPKTFYDYKMMKAETRKGSVFFLLWVGLAFVAAAGVCLAMYYLP